MVRIAFAVPLFLLMAGVATAAVKTKIVTYEHNGQKFQGFLAWDNARTGKQPGVLVVHEWWGLNDYARSRAKMLAEHGYIAFACDMYGEGKHTEHPDEAGKFATEVRKNKKEWQARAQAALEVLANQKNVDSDRVAAIGYCFGGSTALELAYSGADLKAVATFHAALPPATPSEAKAIKARILVCSGADDAFIKPEQIAAFKKPLDSAHVKYEFVSFPGAVHSFTVPGADKKNIANMKYNAEADKKSWEMMLALFKDTLGK